MRSFVLVGCLLLVGCTCADPVAPAPERAAAPVPTAPEVPPPVAAPVGAAAPAPVAAATEPRLVLSDDFATLGAGWEVFLDGDLQPDQWSVKSEEGSLWVRGATRGSRDDTVKFLGVKSHEAFPLDAGLSVSFTVDWNAQANGSYLTAGIFLGGPAAQNEAPEKLQSWLKLQYIGVPPGRNGRLQLAQRDSGRLQFLYTEGWPQNREGRAIARMKARIDVGPGGKGVRIFEDGKLVHDAPGDYLPATGPVHLYLQMSSHSNYPMRSVAFDDVRVYLGKPD